MTGFAVREVDPLNTALANSDAEIGLLTEILHDNRQIDIAADLCRPVDFADPLHGLIFGTIVDERARGRSVDGTTLEPFFRKNEEWHDRKILNTLSAAHLNAIGGDRTVTYAKHILDLAQRRRMVFGLRTVMASAHDLDADRDRLVIEADEAVAEISDAGLTTEQGSAAHYADEVIASFGKAQRGVRCGIIGSIDDLAGPLKPGSFNVLGGRPGMAKTVTATSYGLGASARGHGVLFVSLEMTADELTRRILADLCHDRSGGVPFENIRDGRVDGDHLARVRTARRRLDSMPFEIMDPSRLSLAQLKRRVRRDKRRRALEGGKLELVIVDYLTLMAPSRPGMSLYEHATETSRGLKEMAKAEEVAVIAVAQLSREVEKRPDRRPIPSDLRDSGQIEQDADMIMFLYREEEYLKREKPDNIMSKEYAEWCTDMEAVRDRIEFIMPKRRNGPTGKAIGFFFGACQAVRGADYFSLGDAQS